MEEGLLLVRGAGGGKGDSRSLLLKLGFALALSIAGYFASHFTPKPLRRRLPPPKSSSEADDGSRESTPKYSAMGAHGLKDELRILTSEEALAKIINGSSQFEQVVMSEFEAEPPERNNSTVELIDKELLVFVKEKEEMEKEIVYLRNLVEALKERERSLEMQMIEYLELKEKEATLRELENRLKVSAMESKLLNLKIESLQVENQKLQAQAQALDYPRVVGELETAKEEIQVLRKRLRVDGEQAREKLAALHQRITEMLERERKHGEDDVEIEKKLKRLKELEDEVTDLRMVNSRLAEENLKFVQLLEATKMAASSESAHRKAQALQEAGHLREENDELKKEIEQLQTDRCADVEELVYLRWVNACLRYELRNYQPPSRKTVARDLSKCLSPESEKRAKQLILEYANSGGTNEKNISLFDFDIDTESCSSSQTSSEECSDTSTAASSSTKNSRKSKLISKLKKLVLGKDNQRSKTDSFDGTPMRRASVSPCSFEDMNGRRNSFDSNSSCISVENHMESHPNDHKWHFKLAQPQRPPRSSLDVQRMRRLALEVENNVVSERCRSDLGTSHGHHMRVISEDSPSDVVSHDNCDHPEKVKLKKFADVLKGSHGSVKSKRRLASFS